VVLVFQQWNDFGHRTLFELFFFGSPHQQARCGYTKIMKRGDGVTDLPANFQQLDETYCSLGQSVDYYRALAATGARGDGILQALNDISRNPRLGQTFSGDQAFKTSLLREAEAFAIWNEGRPASDVLLQTKREIRFHMECRLPGATGPHKLDLQFGDGNGIPDQCVAIIGKNGTGKTQLLRKLADSLCADDSSVTFSPQRPRFTRVLTVSYSAFDDFRKPKALGRGSYEYCGIYNESGRLMTLGKQSEIVRESLGKIQRLRREQVWESAVGKALFSRAADACAAARKGEPAQRLGSGELLLLAVLTRVVASIEPQSLVLFDEPELHLHPNAVSGLVQALYDLLEKYNSTAIIATHSPLVLQQIPSKYVRVLDRAGDEPLVRHLAIESFGENLTAITEDIFFAGGEETRYRRVLESLLNKHSPEEINKLFGGNLSLSANSFLGSVKAEMEKGNGGDETNA